MQYVESDLKCGLWESDASITIMCLFTEHCQLDSAWQNILFLSFHDPTCSSDLSLPNFFLFPKLKITLKRRRIQTVENIITNATNELKVMPQTSFKQCFQRWKRQWERCIAAHCNYFEGDNIQ
jgi:hypothetical protein